MFAIIETGGKQYRVSVGEELYIEKLEVAPEAEVVFDKVLMLDEKVGAPYVEGAKVTAVVEKLPEEVSCSFCFYTPLRSLTVVP